MTSRVERIRLHRIRVSHRTRWYLTEISTDDGLVGVGECSDSRDPDGIAPFLGRVASQLLGATTDPWSADALLSDMIVGEDASNRFMQRVVIGSLVTALTDISARSRGVPLWRWLGGSPRTEVPLYANINRAPVRREVSEFVAVAEAAVASGFTRIKLAPFDGPTSVETGLAHVAAVQAAVGPDVTVLVDMHHRVPMDELGAVIRELEELRVGWVEDAVDVHDARATEWLAGFTSLPLAGGERLTRRHDIEQVLANGHLDHLLLDPKYIGGPLRFAAMLDAVNGVDLTLHDPTSPVSTAICAHLSALHPEMGVQEFAFGEDIDRGALIGGTEPRIDDRWIMPDGPGTGLVFTPEAVGDRCETWEWRA